MDITQKFHQPLQQKAKFGSPNTPAEVLCYWLNSFQIQSRDQGVKPEIALVLTHKDLMSSEDESHYIQSYINDIFKAVYRALPYLCVGPLSGHIQTCSLGSTDCQKVGG